MALLGGNGAGKTTFLKILLGQEAADAGFAVFGPSVKVAYLPQVVTFEHPERTLYDTLLYEGGPATRSRPGIAWEPSGSGARISLKPSLASRRRTGPARLCLIMLSRANLLILDEPTNHLDLASREWI